MKKIVLYVFIIASVFSCQKANKKVIDPNAGKKDNDESVVNTYEFTKDGVSTVDIGESKEVILDFRKFNNGINAKKLSGLDLYKREYDTELKPKIGVTLDATARKVVRDYLDNKISSLIELSKSKEASYPARPGKAGYISVSPEQDLLMNSKGVELGQVIQKALMGCLQINNIFYFLDKSILADNTKLVDNHNYTMMQHNWDIAYGYLGRQDVDQERLVPLFLANYIEKEAVGMKGLENIQTKIYMAFYNGRKAIDNKEIGKAKEQVALIKDLISRLVILRTDYYYNHALRIMEKSDKNSLDAQYFHSMGEALGFTLCLSFVQVNGRPVFTFEHSVDLIAKLLNHENGLWNKDALSGTSDGSIYSVRVELSKILPN